MAVHDTTQNVELNSCKKSLLVGQKWMRSRPSRVLGHKFVTNQPFIDGNCICMTAKSESRSVVIVLRSQVWILRIEENDPSTSVLPMGKTARILGNSLTFGKKMLSACFPSNKDTGMDS